MKWVNQKTGRARANPARPRACTALILHHESQSRALVHRHVRKGTRTSGSSSRAGAPSSPAPAPAAAVAPPPRASRGGGQPTQWGCRQLGAAAAEPPPPSLGPGALGPAAPAETSPSYGIEGILVKGGGGQGLGDRGDRARRSRAPAQRARGAQKLGRARAHSCIRKGARTLVTARRAAAPA